MNDELRDLFAKRGEVDRTIASLKRDRADLSVLITYCWQKDQLELVLTEPQPEEGSLTGSEPPD